MALRHTVHLKCKLITAIVLCASACATSSETQSARAARHDVGDTTFARLVHDLSEPGGFFDTDNLISNESSYLHVIQKLPELGVEGGAYIGVGPDQNFSYIAHVRPSIAFIIDIRRDNLLQHLLFKGLFHIAPSRIEYLCHLLGRPPPEDVAAWQDRSIDDLVDYIDARPSVAQGIQRTQAAVRHAIDVLGVPLTEQDYRTIRGIHDAFIQDGLSLRFNTFGRRPQPYYPTFRQLLLETDLTGKQANFLAQETSYQIVRDLQEKNLVVPVVGDLAGNHALRAIGRYVAALGEHVSFFYTSNVEFYLMQDRTFKRFGDNVSQLPYGEESVIARSYFGGRYRTRHPQAVPGYYSTQLLQTIASLVGRHQGPGYRSYMELVTTHALDLR